MKLYLKDSQVEATPLPGGDYLVATRVSKEEVAKRYTSTAPVEGDLAVDVRKLAQRIIDLQLMVDSPEAAEGLLLEAVEIATQIRSII